MPNFFFRVRISHRFMKDSRLTSNSTMMVCTRAQTLYLSLESYFVLLLLQLSFLIYMAVRCTSCLAYI